MLNVCEFILYFFLLCIWAVAEVLVLIVPLQGELNPPFVEQDERAFLSPSEIYYPESWLRDNNRNTIEKGVMEESGLLPGVYMPKRGMPDSFNSPFRVFRPDIKKRQWETITDGKNCHLISMIFEYL